MAERFQTPVEQITEMCPRATDKRAAITALLSMRSTGQLVELLRIIENQPRSARQNDARSYLITTLTGRFPAAARLAYDACTLPGCGPYAELLIAAVKIETSGV